jgi:hypothetical protein
MPELATPEEIKSILPFLTEDERKELDMLISSPSDASTLEAQGWRAWYAEIFGQSFVDALAPHHQEAIEWHWESRMSLRRGEKPDYNSYFPIWSREHMKSAVARRMVVTDACLSVSPLNPFERGGYCLYVSRNKSMVLKHALSIESLITSDRVKAYYPLLSEVKRNVQGGSKGWQATFLNTKADFVFHFSGMDEGLAGGNVEDWRVTMMCLDDIDGREDSPVISEHRFNTLTAEILPMAQDGTLVFFAQNLISRYSSMYRIQKGHARVLTDRKPTQPIKAFNNLVTDVQTVDGIVKDVIVSGEPTWHLFDLAKGQDRMNREGKPAFMRERQHEVEQDSEGLVLKNWNDKVHVIKLSDFARMYGTREIPQRWYKYVFNDWARTKTKYHANVAGIVAVSGQYERLPGCVFLFHPMSFPANTSPEDVARRLLAAISRTAPASGTRNRCDWDDLITSTLQKSNLEHYLSDTTELIQKRRSVLAKIIPPIVKPLLKIQNYKLFRGSHEQNKTGALSVYRDVFGLPFIATNPGGDGGVDAINFLMKVDYSVDHPFRQTEKGYTNFFVVVNDEDFEYNESLTPDDLHDSDLARHQFKNWRYRDPHLTVQGEKEGELLKMNDDFGNGLMMLFHDQSVKAAPLTGSEMVEEKIHPNLKASQIEKDVEAGTRDRQGAMSARFQAINELKQKERSVFTHPLAEPEESW